jgi:hypothetical protein
MMPESRISSLLENGSVNIPAEAKAPAIEDRYFMWVCAALVATQRCGKYVCSSESTRNNKGRDVFC